MKTAALIGISNFARHHLLIAAEQILHGRLRLVAATIVNPDEEAFLAARLRSLGCEVFPDVGAMWRARSGQIDLCFIPTGIHLHATMTLQALRAGASVLVEKPLATSIGDAHAIARLERQTGRFVAVGFQDLYTDSTWTIKRRLLEGDIGRVKSISFRGQWPRPAAYYTRNDWAGRLRLDGRAVLDSPVNNAFAHFFNLALFWAGGALAESARVQRVECELYRAQPIESFDTCCLSAQLDRGIELHACATHSCREERVPALRIEGTHGSIEWVQESHYEIVGRSGERERHAVPGKLETKLMMADAVLHRFENPAARICGTGIAAEHVRLVERLHAAAPIVDVPAAHVRRRQSATGDWREIAGLDAAIDEAAARRCLWSEMDVPWAVRKNGASHPPRARAATAGRPGPTPARV